MNAVRGTVVLATIGALACVGCDRQERESAQVPLPGLGIRLGVEALARITPMTSEGGTHLLYELRITGFDPRSLSLDSLEIVGAADEALRLGLFRGPELRRITRSPGRPDAVRIDPGSVSVIFLAIRSEAEELDSIQHRLWLGYETPNGLTEAELLTKAIPVRRVELPLLDPPVRGGPWYAHAGPADVSHHRTTLAPRSGTLSMDQRFAIDWFKLESVEGEGGRELGGPDWESTLGVEVFAVADGTIVAVKRGVPDEPIGELGASGTRIDWQTIGGNRVVIDLGDGRYAWYHHLLQESIGVEVGDRVLRGQVIGRIGNSGQTSHPHLHFEVTDASTLGSGDGLPYAVRCYSQLARLEPMPSWEEVAEADPSEIGFVEALPSLAESSPRFAELPLGGSVVWFPESVSGDCPTAGAS
jgi:murein DD-endopeptidase MepM/ murein hydrolase activator NlpD